MMGLEIHPKNKKRHRWSSSPVFWRDILMVTTGSLLLHGFVLLIVSLIPPEKPPWVPKEVALVTDFETPPDPVVLPVIDAEIPELNLLNEIKVNEAIPPTQAIEAEPLVEVEPEKDMEVSAEDPLTALADLMGSANEKAGSTETLALTNMDQSLSSGGGIPSAYQGRSNVAERKKKAKTYGADPKVLDAVEKSLLWLAHHQNSDGSWPLLVNKKSGNVQQKKDPAKLEIPKDVANGESEGEVKIEKDPKKINQRNIDTSVAITASALLAFLGAGHTEMSGQHKNTVRKGIRYLNDQVLARAKRPLFDRNYGSALVLMALSESTIFGSSPRTKQNADAIAKMFMADYNGEGWSYSGAGDDFSVSGWVALGLKSARYAELPSITDEALQKLYKSYGKWVNTMTHADTGKGNYRNNKPGSNAMSFVGMFQKQFLGFPPNDPFLLSASQLGLTTTHQYFNAEKMTWRDEYAIYYGTLAAFQQQGPFWKKWNLLMQKTLLGTQRDGPTEAMGGSWDPGSGHIGSSGGRVMSTAILTLCLEVYYRYEMMH